MSALRPSWLLLSLLLGCDQPSGGPDAGLPDAGALPGQGSEASSDLVINEVAPFPASGADWIELTNRAGAPVDLCGYFITDLADRLDHYTGLGGTLPPDPCPPRLLGPGEYLVVWADDGAGASEGEIHARFRLSGADEVHLLAATGLGVDGLSYFLPLADGSSLARRPSGSGLFYPAAPSPGVANPEEAP